MRYISIILIVFVITSCNLNTQSESNSIFTKDIDGMFGILNAKSDESIVFPMDDIHAKTLRNDYDSLDVVKIQKYDILTKDYLKYLSGIEKQYDNIVQI